MHILKEGRVCIGVTNTRNIRLTTVAVDILKRVAHAQCLVISMTFCATAKNCMIVQVKFHPTISRLCFYMGEFILIMSQWQWLIFYLSLSFSHCVCFTISTVYKQHVRYIEDDGNVTRSLNLFDATVPQKVNTINQMISGWDPSANDQVRLLF